MVPAQVLRLSDDRLTLRPWWGRVNDHRDSSSGVSLRAGLRGSTREVGHALADQHRVQAGEQLPQLGGGRPGPSLGGRRVLSAQRGDHLVDEVHLAFRRRAQGPQVARLDAELTEPGCEQDDLLCRGVDVPEAVRVQIGRASCRERVF